MKPYVRVGLIALIALLLSLGSARAGEISSADAARIQSVILSQLDAFKADDAVAAFARAAPTIQRKFGTPDVFLNMVRTAYAPVYRPRHVEFAALARSGEDVVQHVIIEGQDGSVVMAAYPMVQDDRGQWLIAGCYIQQLERKST